MGTTIRHFICAVVAAAILLSVPAIAAENCAVSEPETIALVIGGNEITDGRGFLKNFVYLTQAELDEIRDTNSGSTAYKYGLGDSLLPAPRLYSTHDDHGVPVWHFKKVYGFDLKVLAEALGIDTGKRISITASATDSMVYTLEDAFNSEIERYYYNPQGVAASGVDPILALYETTSTTSTPLGSSSVPLPAAPQTGPGSPDAVLPVFGYGQTDPYDINGCHWVKYVNRLRIGSETAALRSVRMDGSSVTSSISAIALSGRYAAVFSVTESGRTAVHAAFGLPLKTLLSGVGTPVSDGLAIRAVSASGDEITLQGSDLTSAFAAWDATADGGEVRNATALRLYIPDGDSCAVFADLSELQIVSGDLVPQPPSPAFSDLCGHEWAQEAIEYLAENEIVNGTGDGSFSPAAGIRRGDFMLMLHRAYGFEAETDGNFSDVPEGSYYYDAIASAKALGIARGDGGIFNPDSPITRQEAMTLLFRTLDIVGTTLPTHGDLSAFSDAADISDYAREPIRALAAAGVVSGSDGRINPHGGMTRAEMAQALYRALTGL